MDDNDLAMMNFIMLGRIYDALMANLMSTNPGVGANLLNKHIEGTLLCSSPVFNGMFEGDEWAEAVFGANAQASANADASANAPANTDNTDNIDNIDK